MTTIKTDRRRLLGKPVYIYQLLDPISNEIRYIGQSVNPKNRLAFHASSLIPEMKEWIQSLRARKLSPKIVLVKTCKRGSEYLDEKAAILKAVSEGARLFNREWVQPITRRRKVFLCCVGVSITAKMKDGLAELAKKHSFSSLSQAARFAIAQYLRSEGIYEKL